jgi:hypothetical protein
MQKSDERIVEWKKYTNESLEEGIKQDLKLKDQVHNCSSGIHTPQNDWVLQFHDKLEKAKGKAVSNSINSILKGKPTWATFVIVRSRRCFRIISIWIQLLEKETLI